MLLRFATEHSHRVGAAWQGLSLGGTNPLRVLHREQLGSNPGDRNEAGPVR